MVSQAEVKTIATGFLGELLGITPKHKCTREEWLQERKNYIGASDAAAALGISKYKTMAQLAAEKRGEAEDKEPNEAMIRGTELEPVVAELMRRADPTFKYASNQEIVVSPDYSWMSCTPDGKNSRGVVQLKTTISWSKDDWFDGEGTLVIPHEYVAQVQHEMAVTGADVNTLAVMFGSPEAFKALRLLRFTNVAEDHPVHYCAVNLPPLVIAHIAAELCEFHTVEVPRNQAFIDKMIALEEQFWTRYVIGNETAPDALVPQKSQTMLEANEEDNAKAARYRELDALASQSKKELEDIKDYFKTRIGTKAGIETDIGRFTYKTGSNGRRFSKPSKWKGN